MNPIRVLLTLFLFAAAADAMAQQNSPSEPLPSVESVVVTGTKSPQALHDFVGEIAAPTRLAGKLARWEVPVCPLVAGLNPKAAAFIIRRVREVAAGAGARVDRDPICRPNIRIVFTTTPQRLVDDMRKNHGDLLGYYDTLAQMDRMATFGARFRPGI